MFLLLLVSTSSSALNSRDDVNYEVLALINMKSVLMDPSGVLKGWDLGSEDPCSWAIITCSQESLVTELQAPNSNVSGYLSPSIGNLTNLETIQLQNNNLTGPIPREIGKLAMLHYIDLSYNNLSGPVPRSSAKTFKIAGNPMICSADAEKDCDGGNSYKLKRSQGTLPLARNKSHKFAIAFASTIGCVIVLFL
ncbi:hypothetical protein EJB05_45262, partial [Eragrostis curvula]